MSESLAPFPVLPPAKPLCLDRRLSDTSDAVDEKQSVGDDSKDTTVTTERKTPKAGDGAHIITDGEDVSRILVSVRDDGDTALTFRAFIIGTALTALAAVVNQLYYFKPVQVDLSNVFLVIISYFLGQTWARVFPTRDIVERYPRLRPFKKVIHFINPGPLGIKEHALSSVIATSASNGAAVVAIFAAERLFYDIKQHAATAILTTISASLFGYGLVGILRPFCVYPSALVFWQQLPMVAMYQTFHHDPAQNKDRLKFFGYVFSGFAVWEPIASYMFPTLSGVSIFCLSSLKAPAKTRTVFKNLFGGANNNEGLGILSMCFDWQYVTSKFMALPLVQQTNSWIGIAFCYIIVITLYYSNAFNAKMFPFLSTAIFQANGTRYNQKAVFGNKGLTFNPEAFDRIGPPHLAAAYVWQLFAMCMAIGALISHVSIFWGKDMVSAWKSAKNKTQTDPHWVAMQKYEEVPHWWYLVTLAIGFFAGLAAILIGDTTLSWWGYIVALLLGAGISPFSTFLFGVMGAPIPTSAISKMLGGAIHPGKPIANMYFSTFSNEVIVLVVNLSGDLKLSQYLKIPWRTMFITQIYGTILGSFVNYAVMFSIITAQRELLIGTGNNVWSGVFVQGLNSQAITWSMAKHVYKFGEGGYGIVPLGLLIGVFLPVIHWLILKRWKMVGGLPLDKLCSPVILTFMGGYTSGVTSVALARIMTGVVSQYYIRQRYPRWFNKFNYIFGAAADGGAQVMIFILSFAVFGASGKSRDFPTWAGNPMGNVDHCAAK